MLYVLLPLCLINIGVCFCNVIGEALIVEESQKTNHDQSKASNYVSLFFGTRALGTLITAYSSGYLLEVMDKEKVFLITATFPLLTIFSAFLLQENSSPGLKVTDQLDLLWSVLSKKEIYLPVLFIFFFCAVPTGSDAFFYYYTNELHFDPEFMGKLKLVYGVGSLLGMLLYNYAFSEYSFKTLLVSTTIFCMLISLSQILLLTGYNKNIGIPDEAFAIASSFIVQIAAELNLMPLLVLCCRICPKNIEGSLYALLMSTWNFGSMISGQLGALLMIALGIDEKEFGNLWILVLITSFLMVLPLPMLIWVKEDNGTMETRNGKNGYDQV
jgi:folate/biopterin transporter